MSDKTKRHFENTPPMELDTKRMFSTPKKITNFCHAQVHPRGESRWFTLETPSRICPRCKQQLMLDYEKMKKNVNFQANPNVDAVAARGAKPISRLVWRPKMRGE